MGLGGGDSEATSQATKVEGRGGKDEKERNSFPYLRDANTSRRSRSLIDRLETSIRCNRRVAICFFCMAAFTFTRGRKPGRETKSREAGGGVVKRRLGADVAVLNNAVVVVLHYTPMGCYVLIQGGGRSRCSTVVRCCCLR